MKDTYLELARLTEDWDTPATATQRQAAALRYGLARDLVGAGTVVDIACGTGFGIDHVAPTATFAVGGDLSITNLRRAASQAGHRRWVQLNGEALPFRDGVADLVTCFEAIYYLESIAHFLAEGRRVLRPGGRLLVTFPNPARPGFSPSPGSLLYPRVGEFTALCQEAGMSAEEYGAFSWKGHTTASRALDSVRRLLGRVGLMPKSMAMRGLLKRLAYRGVAPLTPLDTIDNPMVQLSPISDSSSALSGAVAAEFLVIYGIATK